METAATDLTKELRAKGYRLTPQRQFVLQAVASLDHATPEAICEEVRRTARGVNLSTVYRTLELLEELGLVTHTHLGHGAQIYHTADQPAHVHLVCRRCGPHRRGRGLSGRTAGRAADAGVRVRDRRAASRGLRELRRMPAHTESSATS